MWREKVEREHEHERLGINSPYNVHVHIKDINVQLNVTSVTSAFRNVNRAQADCTM